ncbi:MULTISPECIES: hypothetical protein [Nonomuraea]|uniref:Integral membrane protein n=1 Tax=Nonomuraea mangrovi TaxID=2316207 RepID=A0ABW4SVC6_9ACTN
MDAVLLSIHVLASIVLVGGSAIATSLFPRYAPVATSVTAAQGVAGAPADPLQDTQGERDRAVAVALHRITRGYGMLGVVVPVAGITLALVQGRMGELWITVSMVLTAVAGGLLALQIYPRQRDALAAPDDGTRLRTLSMLAGIYNLLWAVVVVLMIVRPGAQA